MSKKVSVVLEYMPPLKLYTYTNSLRCGYSFIHSAALREAHSLLQSSFSTECDTVLPVSIYSILSFPQGHPAAALSLLPRLPATSISRYILLNNVF
jgi:hypothetical protein